MGKALRGFDGKLAACVTWLCHQGTRNRGAHGRSCAYRRSEPWGWKPVLYAHEVILNELAQGLRPVAEGVEWFEDLSEGDQRKVLHALSSFSRVLSDPQPTTASHDGGCVDRSGARVPRGAPTGLSHAAMPLSRFPPAEAGSTIARR
ncbi:DUF5958 family protein [Streptomyces scabiei]|uniref:DUF5958 family protein n=1 Tax=Streptomyces scabiei TaxID=1930 RepID=UPI003402DF9C